MSESLYLIEQTLQQLAEERERAMLDGDQPAVEAMDAAIAEYLTQEARKVTSYVGLIRSREATARACNDEIERLQNIRAATVADIDRLKKTAMEVMNRFGVRELKATPGGGLRIQANGGVQALDVVQDLSCFPSDLLKVDLTMQGDIFDELRNDPHYVGKLPSVWTWKPDMQRIREALKRRVKCPQCNGERYESEDATDLCEQCKGEGTVPATIPGAKLLPRGEHLRVL